MTTDVDGNYRGVYTYGIDRISAEDLVSIEGKPNNPLYYLYDAIGTTTSITNMNAGIIDSNRFAPYGEPLDPVAKNSRLTNSPFGFTGEQHDIEGGLVYLRARYYEPKTMQFIQQDTMFGDTKEPLTRNLYIYGNANPLTYMDPSGHLAIVRVETNGDLIVYNPYTGNVFNQRTGEVIEHIEPSDEGTGETEELSEELILMIATVYGEAANCSDAGKEAVANIIMNGVGKREWKKYDTVTKVIKNSGFDAYTHPNDPYNEAIAYLKNRDRSNADIENTIIIVTAVYNGEREDNTDGAVLYYSPKAQAALHKKFPKSYPSLVPSWVNNKVEEVKVSGAEKDDFKFYKYK